MFQGINTERVRGLVKTAGRVLVCWGAIVGIKGLLDAFLLKPESAFVPMSQWSGTWAPFEIVYGTSCILAGIFCFEFIKRLNGKEESKGRIE